jgi:hypothetical protein
MSPTEKAGSARKGAPKWLAPAGSPQHESGGASPEVGEPSGGDECQGTGPHVVIGLAPKEAGQVVAFQDEELHQGGGAHSQKNTRTSPEGASFSRMSGKVPKVSANAQGAQAPETYNSNPGRKSRRQIN